MDTKAKEKEFVMQSYARQDILIDSGKGDYVFSGHKKLLDFIGGIGCVSVGHSNEKVNKAIKLQADKLIQVSNLYYSEEQVKLAEKLSKLSGLKKCFFCNSGAEANEAAIKLAKKATGKSGFIVCKDSFHGRTHGALSATWKEKIKKGFYPLVNGFEFVKYDDIKSIETAISKDTAAVMLEPFQGEAGVIVPSEDYLGKVSELCKAKGVLLILDEVQTGLGRTGKFFCYQHFGIKPDIVTLAKGLANGVPIGVCISDLEFSKGEHGSTFGGNSLSCAAANATVAYILDNHLMDNAIKIGEYFMSELKKLPNVKCVKGKGLMIGTEISVEAAEVVKKCLDKGMLCNNTDEHTLRFLPPLTLTKEEIDEALDILKEALK